MSNTKRQGQQEEPSRQVTSARSMGDQADRATGGTGAVGFDGDGPKGRPHRRTEDGDPAFSAGTDNLSVPKTARTFTLDAPVTRAFMEAEDFWNQMIIEANESRTAVRRSSAVRARLEADGFLHKGADN